MASVNFDEWPSNQFFVALTSPFASHPPSWRVLTMFTNVHATISLSMGNFLLCSTNSVQVHQINKTDGALINTSLFLLSSWVRCNKDAFSSCKDRPCTYPKKINAIKCRLICYNTSIALKWHFIFYLFTSSPKWHAGFCSEISLKAKHC